MNEIQDGDGHRWRFLTDHAQVLACVARDPTITMREIARRLEITERTTAKVVSELELAGYLRRTRVGRGNQYEVHFELPLRSSPLDGRRTVGDLLHFLEPPLPDESVTP